MTFFHDSRLCLQKTEHFVKKSQNILGDKSLTATKLLIQDALGHFSKKKNYEYQCFESCIKLSRSYF